MTPFLSGAGRSGAGACETVASSCARAASASMGPAWRRGGTQAATRLAAAHSVSGSGAENIGRACSSVLDSVAEPRASGVASVSAVSDYLTAL